MSKHGFELDLEDLHGFEDCEPTETEEQAKRARYKREHAILCQRAREEEAGIEHVYTSRPRREVDDWDERVGGCWKCRETGVYTWQRVCNGRPVPQHGMCYQCQGKGWVSHRDEMRTGAYWAHNARSCD